jgi:uncharacterized membrane protein YqjE
MRPMSAVSRETGFFRHSLEVFSASVDYLKARLQLAGIEAKEASVHYVIMLALVVGALVVVTFGYFFFCLALVFLISWALGDGHAWIWVTLGMALLHFGGAAACLFLAKGKLAEPVFTATMREFRKDHEWLAPPPVKQN